jgi:hypothetical protein
VNIDRYDVLRGVGGRYMELYLNNITKNKQGFYVESYKTNNPKIASVKFHYEGTDENLDNFYKQILLDYMKQNKMVVD